MKTEEAGAALLERRQDLHVAQERELLPRRERIGRIAQQRRDRLERERHHVHEREARDDDEADDADDLEDPEELVLEGVSAHCGGPPAHGDAEIERDGDGEDGGEHEGQRGGRARIAAADEPLVHLHRDHLVPALPPVSR